MAESQRPYLAKEEIGEKLVPVLLGGDILIYSLMRCFYDAYGIKSIVLASADVKALSTSKLCCYQVLPHIDEEEFLVNYLSCLGRELAEDGKVGILVGSGDWYARILSKHKLTLSAWYAVPYIDFELLDEITQKERFYALCKEQQMNYPETTLVDCNRDGAPIDVEAFSYPLIAKPSNSALYHYAEFPGKKKIFEVETADELGAIIANLRASIYDKELVIQDFIPGGDDAMYSITMFAVKGDVRITCAGRVILQDHDPSAIGNPVCIMNDWPEDAIDQAARFLKSVSYDGYANFDVKYDARDQSYRFFEVNTRAGRNTYYVTQGGVNFVEPMVEYFVCGIVPEKREARKPFLYTCIPPYVVKRTLGDPVLKEKVLGMYRDGLAQNPLFNKEDTAAHGFWAHLMYWNQIPKFDRFVWKTSGKQAAV